MTNGEVAGKTMITLIFTLCKSVMKHPTDAIVPGTWYGTREEDGFQNERVIRATLRMFYIYIYGV